MPSNRAMSRGAGLDVFDPEPPKDWRLATLPQVMATPAHRGIDQRGTGAGRQRRPRPRLRDFLKEGDHPQRGELSFRVAWKHTSGCGRI